MRPREPDMHPVDAYAEAMALYRRGRYAQAAERLSPLAARGDAVGHVARFYVGMSHRALGIESMREGRYRAAEGHLRAAMRALGREADLATYLAAVYANTARPQACAGELEKLPAEARRGPTAWRHLAQAHWQAGRRAEAYMTLSEAERRFAPNAELKRQLALFYAAEDRFEEALRAGREAVDADCSDAEAHRVLGLAAAARGNVAAARRAFQRAFELRPHDLLAAMHLAMSARASAERGEAVVLRLPKPGPPAGDTAARQLAGYVTAESDFVEAFLELPASAIDGELFELLAGVLQTALADHGSYADLHYHCGRVFRRLGRLDRALHHARRAVEINPAYVQARLLLARLNGDRSDAAAAAKEMRRAIDLGADWPDIHCEAADWLVRCRRYDQARAHLTRALELKAAYPRASEALARLAA